MPWIIEDLIGVKDSVNKVFTISYAPIKTTLAVVQLARRLRPVAFTPQPGQYEFGINDLEIVLGHAPDSDEDLWTRYYTEESGEGLMIEELTSENGDGKQQLSTSKGGGYGVGGPYGIES